MSFFLSVLRGEALFVFQINDKGGATVKNNTRGLVTRTQCGTTVDNELFNKLNSLSKQTRITKSRLLDEALELLFKKHNAS